MQIERTSEGWVVRLGPFADEVEARRRAVLALAPGPIAQAVSTGESYLSMHQGHYTLRVDGGPCVSPVVVFGTGSTFRDRGQKVS